MNQETIQSSVREVAEARRELAVSANLLAERKAAFDAENKELLDLIAIQRQAVEKWEGVLREQALFHYEETGDKAPCDGVQVKIFTKYVYDPDKALEWAQAHKIALVPESLDKKAFEKIAAVQPIEFVEKKEEPQAQIASKL